MKISYKTTIVDVKNKNLVDAVLPDSNNDWELHSVTVKKHKIFYHWRLVKSSEMNFTSSDVDFKNALSLVKSHSEKSLQESESNVDNK